MGFTKFFKLFVTEIPIKRCVNCIYYKPETVGQSYCKIYGNVVEARINSKLCGIDANNFKRIKWEREQLCQINLILKKIFKPERSKRSSGFFLPLCARN